ncbi:hypothetical protein M0R45_008684 [Rubus argutus]|uniref:TIR domain-containing protein n=1 Tax=Rubus argutus TaxID=59490 RepID=A0AAW1Y3M6_RUBAR
MAIQLRASSATRLLKHDVLKWRTALTEAANLSGWHFSDGYESKFINEIVEEISAQQIVVLPRCSPSSNKKHRNK